MSYNINELPKYINTAGKITIITSLLGVVVFAVVFLLNIGANELKEAEAQSGLATTTITVLNTPPQWSVNAQEQSESSTSTPTNSGDTVTWTATATDSDDGYYLLICNGTTSPTPVIGGAPTCGGSDIQWAVSAAASSGVQATAATTTIDSDFASDFAESNVWAAWICDYVAPTPRCNATYMQGTATTASPFNVNSRPDFTAYSDSSPADPGTIVTFYATSSDPDSDPVNDTVRLYVCSTNSFNATSSLECNGTGLATSTFTTSNPTATYTLASVLPDQNYNAYGFIIDVHGHLSDDVSQGTDAVITVSNVAPTVPSSQIDLNTATSMILTQNAGETTGFTLDFYASDANSCQNASAGDEIEDYLVSVYRSGIGSTTCNGTNAGNYNPNNCYTTGVPTSTWNLACTASSTTCTGTSDPDILYECSFPLWYVADPTDGTSTVSQFPTEDWRAAVSAIDDDGATTTIHTETDFGRELLGFLYLALDTLAIPYADREPGQATDPLVATTTIRSEGNTGMDELLTGESMCNTYTSAAPCPVSASSTIPESEQVFATSSISYGAATSSGNTLSSSTQKFLDLNVPKSTATTTATSGVTYWGIRVPSSITLSGLYTGENTFFGLLSDPSQW